MKITKFMAFAMMATATTCFVACDDDDDDNNETISAEDLALDAINEAYVTNVVYATYSDMAAKCKALNEAVEAIADDNTMAAAGTAWKAARKQWEWSESHLFGPAGDYGIDPHIDTWPFNKAAFESLKSKYLDEYVSGDVSDEAADVIAEQVSLSQNLTGFHAVEYILFKDGAVKSFSELDAFDIAFAQSAAEDLYLNSLKLKSCWGKTDSSEDDILEEAEFEGFDYEFSFRNAGQGGSRYKTVKDATSDIFAGMADILGEVGGTKIGTAHNASTDDDRNNIESPYAQNSIQDFTDNILGCVHAFYGSRDIASNSPKADDFVGATGSLATYCLAKAPKETAEVSAKFLAAIAAVQAMKAPFVTYYADKSAGDAMDAIDELTEALDNLEKAVLGE